MEFEKIFEVAKEIIEKANGWDPSVKDAFSNLSDIQQVFKDFRRCNFKDSFIEDACTLLLCSGYLVLRCCAASLSNALREMLPLELKFPRTLRPRVKVIESYMDSIRKTLEEIDAKMSEIKKKIIEVKPRGYKLTDEEKFEMGMLMQDIQSDLETAEDYQKSAEEELQSLSSESESHKENELGSAVTLTFAMTLLTAGGSFLEAIDAGESVSMSALRGGLDMFEGARMAMMQIDLSNRAYQERQIGIENLKADLKILEKEVKKKKRKGDDVHVQVEKLALM